MSQFGKLEHILDLETILGYQLSKIDFSCITKNITYSWGDESELIKWIRYKDSKEQFDGNFITFAGTEEIKVTKKPKYPLIWLATPVQGINQRSEHRFNNVQIIVCNKTDEQWLNSTRWKKNIPLLKAIANHVIGNLKGGVYIARERGIPQFSHRTITNYGISESGSKDSKSKALDFWDAVVITTDLIVNNSCRDEDYYCFCNK